MAPILPLPPQNLPYIDANTGTVALQWQNYLLSLQQALQATVDSTTYTPTLTAVANVSAKTAYATTFLQVGNVVTVAGRVDVDPTAAVATKLGISLPVPSLFTTNYDAGGTAASPTVPGEVAAIVSDPVNDRAEMQWTPAVLTNNAWWFSFSYKVF